MKDEVEKRLCLFCEHFHLTLGERDWSEYTPGSPGSADCGKGVWAMDADDCPGEGELRQNMLKAEGCRDFTRVRGKPGG